MQVTKIIQVFFALIIYLFLRQSVADQFFNLLFEISSKKMQSDDQ